MDRYVGHFKTIVKHKWHVFNGCRKSGIPLRGLKHDLSKFSTAEFKNSAVFFNGTKSPIAVEKEVLGYSTAWAHHKGHNTHHWEYWTDWNHGEFYCVEMPIEDVKEMLCDWIGAGKAYNNKAWSADSAYAYYEVRKDHMYFHPKTKVLVDILMTELLFNGEEEFYKTLKAIK